MSVMEYWYNGNLQGLPVEDTNVIKIFVSSNSTDMAAERHYLAKYIYPDLRNTAMLLGLDLQIADLKWGVNSSLLDDSKTTEAMEHELLSCKNFSSAINFIAFVGDKNELIPKRVSKIPAMEFDILMKLIPDVDGSALFHKWFQKNENSVPPMYILTIHDKSVELGDYPPFGKMQSLLKLTAEKAVDMQLLTKEQSNKYILTATENEIEQGIFQSPNPLRSSACFYRSFQSVDFTMTSSEDEAISQYFLTDENGRILNEQIKRQRTCAEEIKKVVHTLNTHHYDVTWKTGGINLSSTEHKKYLKRLGENVKAALLNTIHGVADERLNKGFSHRSNLFKEILFHCFLCVRECDHFYGRKKLLHDLRSVIKAGLSTSNGNVLVIRGDPGSGKTSLISMLAKNAKTWFKESNLSVIFRFLGTSIRSRSLHEVLISLCDQISELYGFDSVGEEILHEIRRLIMFFHSLLDKIPSSKPLMILLDSIEQLSSISENVDWLPMQLQQYVYIVVTISTRNKAILESCGQRYNSRKNLFEVKHLESSDISLLLQKYQEEYQMQLSQVQRDYVTSCCELNPHPVYLKLVLHEAKKWKSQDDFNDISIPITTTPLIESILQNLETEHGQTAVSHALSYITLAKMGLTENELLDILSLDNFVLNEAFGVLNQPTDEVLRYPMLLWKRIRCDISFCLVERTVDGSSVLQWTHDVIKEAIEKRYLWKENLTKYLNGVLAEFFIGEFSTGNGKSIKFNQEKKGPLKPDRKVRKQMLQYNKTQYNVRKLYELPRILINLGDASRLFDLVFFNYDWLEATIKGLSLHHFLLDLETYLKSHDSIQVQLLHQALIQSHHSVHKVSESHLANQLLGRLIGFTAGYPFLSTLLNEAKKYVNYLEKPVFLVETECWPAPSGFLNATFKEASGSITYLEYLNEKTLLCLRALDDVTYLSVYSIKGREIVKSVELPFKNYWNLTLDQSRESCFVLADKIYQLNTNTLILTQIGDIPCQEVLLVKTCENRSLAVIVYQSGEIEIRSLKHESVYTVKGFENITCCEILNTAQQIAISSDVHPLLALVSFDNIITCLETADNDSDEKPNRIDHFSSEDENSKRSSLLLTSHQNTYLVTSFSSVLHLWSCETNSYVCNLKGHRSKVTILTNISDELIASGSEDGSIIIWSLSQQASTAHLGEHEKGINCLRLNENTGHLVSGSKDKLNKVWNLNTKECVVTLCGHESCITAIDVSPDNKRVISGSDDGVVKLWCVDLLDEKTCRANPLVNIGDGMNAIISASGKYVAVLCAGGKLVIWNVEMMTLWKELCLDNEITVSAFANSGNTLFLGTSDGTLQVFQLVNQSFNEVHKHHNCSITAIEVLNHDESVISADECGTIILFNFKGENRIKKLSHHEKTISSLFLSRNNRLLISGCVAGKLNVYRIAMDLISHVKLLKGHNNPISATFISSDNKYLCSGDQHGLVLIWDLDCNTTIHKFQVGSHSVTGFQFMKGMSVIISTTDSEEQLMMTSLDKNVQKVPYRGHTGGVIDLKVTEDSKYLITGSSDATLRLWHSQSGQIIDAIGFERGVSHFDMSLVSGDTYQLVVTLDTGAVAFVKLLVPSARNKSRNGKLIFMTNNDDFVPVASKNCCQKCEIL